VACLHLSFRTVFAAVGQVFNVAGRVQTTLLSATASPSAVCPVLDFFHLRPLDVTVIRDRSAVFRPNICLRVEALTSDAGVLQRISMYAADDAAGDLLPAQPRRILIIVPSKALVDKVLERLEKELPGNVIFGVTGDSSPAHIEAAIVKGRIVVATTVLSTAATMTDLDLCILAYTTWSVQVSTC